MKIAWHNEKRKLKDLKPWDKNPRKSTEKQEKDLDKSLDRFNLADPLIININNIIIGGHFRYRRLKEKGIKEVDVRVPNRKLTEKEVEELNIRLNKNQGSWDEDLLKDFGEDLLKDIGFLDEEMDEIFGLDIDDDFNVQKELEKALKQKAKRVKTGDLWQLGEHRLIIGSCTDKKNWQRLLGEERFDFMFTDPPYKLSYSKTRTRKVKTSAGMRLKRIRTYLSTGETDKKGKPKGFGLKGNRIYLGVEKGGGVPEYDDWLSIAKDFQNSKGVNVMIFENWRNSVELWQAMKKYWKIRNQIIWWLPNRYQGFSNKHHFYNKYDIAPLASKGKATQNEEYEKELDDYLIEKGQKLLDSYEVILYGQQGKEAYWDKKKGTRWAKINDHITGTAETGKSSGQNIVFGTKPIKILVPYIKILSPRNGIVVEPFGGSGSTIIASEIMKRKCRAIEIEPLYGEVIIRRFERFTNKKAIKIK